MKMTIPYNLTGKQRKQLAEDISVALHTIPKYLGYPTCSYQIGDCILERDGKLIIPECVANDTATALLEHLRSRGYVGEAVETEDRLTISMPRELFTENEIEILQQIVTAKTPLLKKAFLAESLEAMVTDTTVSFPWFPFTAEPDEVNAYSTFVAKLCDMARRQKRVVATPAETDNEKYAFRCLLLRLGFIGYEYKIARKVLLKNLSGNSAFRYGDQGRS
ncbi:MAG: hypothetical protein GX556_05030 [Fibrobacter sp.]|nr:hypothetical protein [Fibrobacter sp.]